MDDNFNVSRRLILFTALAAASAVLLVLCNLIGGKLFGVEVGNASVLVSAGLLPMPLCFVMSSLIQEMFGARASRIVTGIALGLGVLTAVIVAGVGVLPFASITHLPSWEGVDTSSFRRVFLSSQRILVASMVAFAGAQACHIALMGLLKRTFGGLTFGVRALVATVISQLLDTVIVEALAWYGLLPLGEIARMAIISIVIKFVLSLAVGPLASIAQAAILTWLQGDRAMPSRTLAVTA